MFRLIIAILFSLQLSGQVLKTDSYTEKHVTTSTYEACSKLFKGPSFQNPIIIIKYAPLHPRIVGLTREISSGVFIVDLNPIYSEWKLERTLIHEITHVYQIYNGILKIEGECFVWKNQEYPFSTPYKTRPWEIDAENAVKLICDN